MVALTHLRLSALRLMILFRRIPYFRLSALFNSTRSPSFIALCGLALCSPMLHASYGYNLRPGVSEISRSIHSLHMTIFYICLVIAVLVFSVMFYAIIWHRKSRGAKAAHFHEHLIVEIIWTFIPCVILVAMAIPAARLIIKTHDMEDSELSIKVTGHQWYWEYEYLAEGLRIYSRLATPQAQIHNRALKGPHYLREVDQPLVIPQNKKVRFLTTANDVIHSWWVPDFGIKRDAIPGFINETWTRVETPGIYRGQCAELCGALHGFMPIVVEVKTPEDYEIWLKAQKEHL